MSQMMIGVSTHKEFPFALPQGYEKIQVNCRAKGEHWQGYIHDDSGDEISEKNYSYCELTALYWLWKNSDADIKGLCHYRRFFYRDPEMHCTSYYHFSGKKLLQNILQPSDVHQLLNTHDAIVLAPYAPYPKTAKEDLLLYCYEQDIDIMTRVVSELYPEYMETYDAVMGSYNLSYCNMIIAKKSVFDDYCKWLFSILELCEQRCDITNYDTQHKRLYGYLAEVLMNVYLRKNGISCAELRYAWVTDFDQTNKKYFPMESIAKLAYRLGLGKIWESLYKRFRPDGYAAFSQYRSWQEQRKKDAEQSF